MSTSKDRYPGLRAFERDDQELFFGRDEAVTELISLIKSEKITILFGNSGTGKSSLLNTKVSSQLESDKYLTIRIRFTGGLDKANKTTPLQIVQKELELVIHRHNEPLEIIFDSKTPKIWEYIKVIERVFQHSGIYKNGLVLIFDQFEEFFYFPESEQLDFNEQLAELVHDWPPKRILDWVNDLNEAELTPEILQWHRQPEVRVVFSIRSDKLSLMNGMIKVLPKVLRSRYELKTFGVINATSAIIEPGLLPNDKLHFTSPPIKFESVKDLIINELKNDAGEIEVSFLQVICSYLETFVITKRKYDRQTPYEITKDDLVELKFDVSSVLDKHYQDQTDKFSDADKKLIRKVIEDDLVISGQRASLLKAQLVSKLNGNEQLISELLKARLIREETTARGITYELSHDRLIPAVEKYKAIRQELEINEELLRQYQERKENIQKQRIQLNIEKRLRKEAEDQRKLAEREKENAKHLEARAIKEKMTAEDLKLKAEEAKREANKQKKIAGVLSLIIFSIGTVFLIYATRSKIRNELYLKTANLQSARYFVVKGSDEYKKLNVYQGFNYFWKADSLMQIYDSTPSLIPKYIFRAKNLKYSDDGNIQVYQLYHKLQVWYTKQTPYKLLKEFSNVESFAISGNGNTLILSFENAQTEIWNISELKKIGTLERIDFDHFTHLVSSIYTLSWNGNTIGYFDHNELKIVDILSDTIKERVLPLPQKFNNDGFNNTIYKALVFSRDGNNLLVHDENSYDNYWLNLKSSDRRILGKGKMISTTEYSVTSRLASDTIFLINNKRIWGLDISTGKETQSAFNINDIVKCRECDISASFHKRSGHISLQSYNSPITYFVDINDFSRNFVLNDLWGNIQMYKDLVFYSDTSQALRAYNLVRKQFINLNKTITFKPEDFGSNFSYSEPYKKLFYIQNDSLLQLDLNENNIIPRLFSIKSGINNIEAINNHLILELFMDDDDYLYQVNTIRNSNLEQLRRLIPYLPEPELK